MLILAISITSILSIIALLHFYWSFGGQYGVQSVAPKPVGEDEIKIPRALAFIVGCLIMLLGVLAIFLAIENNLDKQYESSIGYLVSVVVVVRAIGEFRYLGFFKKIYNSSFAKKDTFFFSPLCLILGISFFVLSKLNI